MAIRDRPDRNGLVDKESGLSNREKALGAKWARREKTTMNRAAMHSGYKNYRQGLAKKKIKLKEIMDKKRKTNG